MALRQPREAMRSLASMMLLAKRRCYVERLPDSGMFERGSQQVGVEPRRWQRRDPDDVDARGPRGGDSGR